MPIPVPIIKTAVLNLRLGAYAIVSLRIRPKHPQSRRFGKFLLHIR